jgi:hypothetical protein
MGHAVTRAMIQALKARAKGIQLAAVLIGCLVAVAHMTVHTLNVITAN